MKNFYIKSKMSEFNEELLSENSLRINQRIYAKTISKYINYFKDNLLCIPRRNAWIQNEEGTEAYQEAVDLLSKPLSHQKVYEEFPKIFFCCSEPDTNDLENIDMEYIINKYGSFSG